LTAVSELVGLLFGTHPCASHLRRSEDAIGDRSVLASWELQGGPTSRHQMIRLVVDLQKVCFSAHAAGRHPGWPFHSGCEPRLTSPKASLPPSQRAHLVVPARRPVLHHLSVLKPSFRHRVRTRSAARVQSPPDLATVPAGPVSACQQVDYGLPAATPLP
jgi:hypothetical protein